MTGSGLNSAIAAMRGLWWALQLQSRALAERLFKEAGPDERARISRLYELTLARRE